MWAGYERALCHYAAAVCIEWRRRGYRDEQLGYFLRRRHEFAHTGRPPEIDAEFQARHRAILFGKRPDLYARYAR